MYDDYDTYEPGTKEVPCKESYDDVCVKELSGCCGVNVVFDLSRGNGPFPCTCKTEDSYCNPQTEEGFKKWLDNETVENYAMTLATTTPNQKFAMKALEKAGFKPLANGQSGKTGRVITLWVRVNNKVKATELRKLKIPKAA